MSEALTPEMTPTDQGNQMMARAVAQEQLTFTRMAMGDGQIANVGSIPSMTVLIHERVSVAINKSKRIDNVITVSGPVNIPANSEAFKWRELGLFGKIGDEPEKLLAVIYKGESGEMVSPADGEERSIYVSIKVDAAANVTVTLGPRETVDWDQINNPPVICRPARIVVGSATHGWTEQDCDYLCSTALIGNASPILQNAIDALPADGGEIILLSGAYRLTGSLTVAKKNVTIRGNGKSTEIYFGWNEGHFDVTGDHFTLQDLTLRIGAYTQEGSVYGAVTTSGQFTTVKHVYFDHYNNDATHEIDNGILSTSTAKYTRILDCIFVGCRRGLNLQGTFETARGNTFLRAQSTVQCQAGTISGHYSIINENIIVTNRMTGFVVTAGHGNIEANNISASG